MYKRIVDFSPAFDRRHKDPKKNYGVCAVQIRFVLKGDKGAVQLLLGTTWYLPETIKEYNTKGVNGKVVNLLDDERDCSGISGYDVGYHSKKSMYKDQRPIDDDCPYTNGVCYYDGSGLRAKELPEKLIREGSESIWKYLMEEYKSIFGDDTK